MFSNVKTENCIIKLNFVDLVGLEMLPSHAAEKTIVRMLPSP